MNSSNKRTLIAGLSAIACASVFAANAASSILAPTSTRDFFAWGGATVADAKVAGAPAQPVITVTTAAKGAQTWASAGGQSFTAPVKKGEVLTASFYVRALSPATATTDFSFEKGKAPYTSSSFTRIPLTKSWKKITIKIVSKEDYAPNDAHVVFHTGYGKESFQIAGLTLTPSK